MHASLTWLLAIALAITLLWFIVGRQWYEKYRLYKANEATFQAVAGAQKIYGDVLNEVGLIKGAADALGLDTGSFTSRGGRFNLAVGN